MTDRVKQFVERVMNYAKPTGAENGRAIQADFLAAVDAALRAGGHQGLVSCQVAALAILVAEIANAADVSVEGVEDAVADAARRPD